MEPETSISAEAANLAQRIDRSSRGGSGRADHHEGQQTVSAIFGHALLEIFHLHSQRVVGRDDSQIASSKTHHVRDFTDAIMSFLGQVNGGFAGQMSEPVFAIFRESPCKCDHYR